MPGTPRLTRPLWTELRPILVPDDTDVEFCQVCDSELMSNSECPYCDAGDDDDSDEYDDYSDYSGGVNSWDYRPRPIFHGDGPVFMGFELELAGGYSLTEAIDTANRLYPSDQVYLKEDGSISPRGFEFVTHPMAYEWALQNFNWDGLQSLHDDGMEPNETCGLHVHVNRDGFSTASHTYRWLKFMYRNQLSMQRMARRTNSGYSSFGDTAELASQRKIHKDVALKKPAQAGVRYSAVNATNEHTFEVRMFASTLHKGVLQAALGLVDASVEYTRIIRASDILRHNAWTMRAFMGWVEKQEKYEALTREYNRLCVS